MRLLPVLALFGGTRAIGTQRDLRLTLAEERSSVPAPVASPNTPRPWPRDGFVAAYSRQQGEAFVLSARSAGREAELWAHSVDTETWQRLALRGNVRVEKPTSAVFLPASNALWVLDETRTGFLRVARLLRIDRATGEVKVMFTYPRLGLYDTQYLVEDRDGRLLLVASSKLFSSHLLLSVTDAGDIAAYAAEKGALVYAPIVDAEGYTFFVRGKTATPVVRSVAHLRMRPGRSPDTHRCF